MIVGKAHAALDAKAARTVPTAFANGSGPSIRFGGWFDESWNEITDVLRQAGISTPDAFSEWDGPLTSSRLQITSCPTVRGLDRNRKTGVTC